jgi:hypothetical protein
MEILSYYSRRLHVVQPMESYSFRVQGLTLGNSLYSLYSQAACGATYGVVGFQGSGFHLWKLALEASTRRLHMVQPMES